MAHHSAAGKSTGALKARTGTVRSFLSNSICPHFNFLSFYALLRINVPRLLPLPNRPPHWHHQSSTAKFFAYVTFTHLPIDRTRRRVWKKRQHSIDVAYLPVSASSHLGWEFIARGLANEQTPPGEYDKLFETLERRPSHWRQQIRH